MAKRAHPAPIRPRRSDAEQNHNRILRIAGEAIEQFGADASLRDIARKAGIGMGTLYRHFPSREALLETLLRERLSKFAEEVRQARTFENSGEALGRCVRDYLRGVTVYKGVASSLIKTLKDSNSALHSSCSAVRGELEALLKMAQENGSIRADVTVADIFTFVNGLAWMFDQGTGSLERRSVLVQVFLDGLRKRE